MSRRQVMCRWCYNYGHNIRGCPDMKKSAQAGSSYAQEKIARSAAKCSYCFSTGHKVSTCISKYNNDLGKYHQDIEWRNKMIEHLANMGFGVGCIVKVEYVDYQTYNMVSICTIVSGIAWVHIGLSLQYGYDNKEIVTVFDKFNNGYNNTTIIPFVNDLYNRQGNWTKRVSVISPVPYDDVKRQAKNGGMFNIKPPKVPNPSKVKQVF